MTMSEVKDVHLSVHVYERTFTAPINHSGQRYCMVGIPTFIKIHAVRM